jgi:hypothetical protein
MPGKMRVSSQTGDFLIRERTAIPLRLPAARTSRISSRPRPGGAADPTRAAYRKLNRDHPTTDHSRTDPHAFRPSQVEYR